MSKGKIEEYKSRLGWLKELPDVRDRILKSAVVETDSPLPRKSRNRETFLAPILDQGNLGSCTGNAYDTVFEFERKIDKQKSFTCSRLFLYYEARKRLGPEYINIDSGAYIRDVFKVAAQLGVPRETTWKYDITKFNVKPSNNAYRYGATHQAEEYLSIPDGNLYAIKKCLADGHIFEFGFTVYTSFLTGRVNRDGIMELPKASDRVQGGHAVAGYDYDDDFVFPNGEHGGVFIPNSWGEEWGGSFGATTRGWFVMPYSYISNPYLSDDFWTLRKVEGR